MRLKAGRLKAGRLKPGLLLALGALALVALWATGTLGALGWRIAELQRALQGLLAGEIAALRGGERAALAGLIGLCGAYGFLHALGPGHGKALIAGAAVGTRATARRMALIALAGSLAQAGVAVAAVYGGFTLLGVTARGLTGGVAAWLEPVGNIAIALIGAWLLARGVRALRAPAALDGRHGHAHGPDCRHAHGPTPAEAEQATSLGATLALIGAMAARPCTGAIFVLVIAWRMGLPGAGAAAALAMGLGTAAFTALVGWLAVGSRDAAFLSAGGGGARLLAPSLQIAAGGLIVAISVLPAVGALVR